MNTLKDKLSSPIEILLKTLSYPLVVGLSPQTIIITIYLIKFLNTYWHTNINMQSRLSNVLQRHGSCNLHQIKSRSKYSFTDLLLIDMIRFKDVTKGRNL